MGAEEARRTAEHRVADLELTDSGPDGFDLTGQVDAKRSPSRPAEPEEQSPEEWRGRADVNVALRDRRGTDPDENFIVLGHGPLHLFDPEHFRRPVAILDDGSHAITPYRVHRSPASRRWRRIRAKPDRAWARLSGTQED